MPEGKPGTEERWSTERILETGRSFWEARVLLAAAELNLFTLLARKPSTARGLAREARTDPRATERLLDALAAMELLEKQGDRYRVAGAVAAALSDDSPESVLPMLQHQSAVFRRWAELPTVVRTGESSRQEGERHSAEETRAFIGGMHVLGQKRAPLVADAINIEQVRQLLDIGGASGTYTIEFLRRSPDMKSTLFDLPEVVELARDRLAAEGLLDRVRLVGGDFYSDPLPEGHDLAFLSAIIHQNSREQNRDLYSKTCAALIPGGRIVIRDHVMDPTRTRPRAGALFAINMLVGTPGGGTYTFDEIREDLEAAGFIEARLLEADQEMNGLVQAVKPN